MNIYVILQVIIVVVELFLVFGTFGENGVLNNIPLFLKLYLILITLLSIAGLIIDLFFIK